MERQRWLLGVAALLLAACTPFPHRVWITAPLDQVSISAKDEGKLRVGDIVRIEGKNGVKRVLQINTLAVDAFVGVTRDGKNSYRVAYADLLSLEVQRVKNMWIPIGMG